MRYRPLGRTGIHVSPYALGTMNFGAMFNTGAESATRLIHRALDAGINLIDTADVYSRGESEEIIGRAIQGHRDEIVLATKFANPMGETPNERGGSRRWITRAIEDSLRRLRTDYIDLYQYHYLDSTTDLEETLATLTDLIHTGKVRAIGSSKFPPAEIVEGQWISERRGLARFRCEQPTYSILNRAIERDVLPLAERYGIGTIVYSPLAQGLLTGRVRKGQASQLTREGAYFAHLDDAQRVDAVEQLIPIAEGAGLSLTHLAMAFAVTHPGVSAALLGPRTVEQLDDLIAGAENVIDDATLDQIDHIVAPGQDIGALQMVYTPPALTHADRRRRPTPERAAA